LICWRVFHCVHPPVQGVDAASGGHAWSLPGFNGLQPSTQAAELHDAVADRQARSPLHSSFAAAPPSSEILAFSHARSPRHSTSQSRAAHVTLPQESLSGPQLMLHLPTDRHSMSGHLSRTVQFTVQGKAGAQRLPAGQPAAPQLTVHRC